MHPRPHPFCNCAKIEETHNRKQHPKASRSLLELLPPENYGSPLVPWFSSCDPSPNPLLLRTLFAAIPLPSSAPQSPVCSFSFLPSFLLCFVRSLLSCWPAPPCLGCRSGDGTCLSFPSLGTLDCLRNLCNGTQGQRRWAEAPAPPNKMVGNCEPKLQRKLSSQLLYYITCYNTRRY